MTEGRVAVSTTADEVKVRVEDDGAGLDAIAVASAFEVSLGSRSQRVGMRIGLPMARQVIERFGAHVELQSEPGRGTRLLAMLPASV